MGGEPEGRGGGLRNWDGGRRTGPPAGDCLAAGTERAGLGRLVPVLVCARCPRPELPPAARGTDHRPGPGGSLAAGVVRIGGPRGASGPVGPAAEWRDVRGNAGTPEVGPDPDGPAP